MEPVQTPYVVHDEAFTHQIKWDGIRGIAMIENGAVRLYNKSGIESTGKYPELSILPQSIRASQAVLDGEIVTIVDGKPSFYHVLKRSLSKGAAGITKYPVHYIVFDLLSLDHADIRPLPLEERQRMLREHFKDSAVAAQADSFNDGEALYALMKRENLEGIVSKRLSSRYTAGKQHTDWFKTKIMRKVLCAVTGVNYKNGLPSSLSLGVFRDGVLAPAGDVGSGLKPADLALLAKQLKPGNEPILACWVRFSEWTPAATLRNPVFLGFSDAAPTHATGEEQSL
jgi:bifunctional non-homologous end joining protein LigD